MLQAKRVVTSNDKPEWAKMHSESVDEYANRIKNLCKRIEFNDSTLKFALLNGLKPAIKRQVLAKNPQSFAEAVDGDTTCGIISIR